MSDFNQDGSGNPYSSSTPMSPSDEKTWAIVLHILAIPFEFFAPLLGYLLLRNKGPFIAHHTRESLNFGITVLLVAIVMAISLVGLFFIWILPIYWLVFRVIAAIKASEGEFYRFPLTLRIIQS